MAIRLLKPEEAAKRASKKVKDWQAEQARKAADAKRKPPTAAAPAQRPPEGEGPAERPTLMPPNSSPGLDSENPFAKRAPLVEEPQRPKAPCTKEQLTEALMSVPEFAAGEMIDRLLKDGADVNSRNGDGLTVLMKAAFDGKPKTARKLIEVGAEVNATDPNGSTALMAAASSGNTGIALLLIEAGADVNARDCKERSALDNAKTWGRTDVIGILKNHGAAE